jgi:hypothetical protein
MKNLQAKDLLVFSNTPSQGKPSALVLKKGRSDNTLDSLVGPNAPGRPQGFVAVIEESGSYRLLGGVAG